MTTKRSWGRQIKSSKWVAHKSTQSKQWDCLAKEWFGRLVIIILRSFEREARKLEIQKCQDKARLQGIARRISKVARESWFRLAWTSSKGQKSERIGTGPRAFVTRKVGPFTKFGHHTNLIQKWYF